MINDVVLRALAVVAMVAVVAGPSLVAYAKAIFSSQKGGIKESVMLDDAHTVVEIARRLQKSGNQKGADLCKNLLDVMLSSETPL
jgi:hypothetical protein